MRVVTNRSRRLSEGLVTEATVEARLLGLRVLSIDATIVIAPAEVDAPAPRTAGAAGRPAVGADLSLATRFIGEGEEALAAARRDGSG